MSENIFRLEFSSLVGMLLGSYWGHRFWRSPGAVSPSRWTWVMIWYLIPFFTMFPIALGVILIRIFNPIAICIGACGVILVVLLLMTARKRKGFDGWA